MGAYAMEWKLGTATTVDTVGSVVADSTRPRRMAIYDLILGSSATPTDAAIEWVMARITAEGTNTDVVPSPLDPADAATEADAGEAHTVEPTYTSALDLLTIALNHRSTFRWVATERGRLITPATAANGVGLKTPVISTGTPAVSATCHFEEQ